MTLLYLESWQI